jgi:2-aminoadipate transaminase
MTSLSPIKLTRGVPPPEAFPTERLAECATAVLHTNPGVVLQYGSAGGYAALRQYVAAQYKVGIERVMIGQGSLQLLDTVARVMVKPGDVVYVEQPSYDRAITVLRRAGARLVGIPLAADGPDVDFMVDRLKSGERPVLFYIIPDFQNPSGTVMSLEKRQRMAGLAAQYGFYYVEDSPYRKLRYHGAELPTLFDLAPERVMQMSSYSKLIAPGLRVGYVVAAPELASGLLKFSEDTYINASYFNQAIVHEFIQRGWLDENIATLKRLYAPRLEATLDALAEFMAGQATWAPVEGGFFVGLTLKKPVGAADLLARASAAGLLLTDGRGFFTNFTGDRFVRLPFCALTPEEIAAGVARLAVVVKDL